MWTRCSSSDIAWAASLRPSSRARYRSGASLSMAPFIATEADHPFIAEVVNKARPGKGAYVALDGSDHGFRKTTSIEDSFTRRKSPGGEFNPQIITTLKEWMEKVRMGQ